MCVVSVAKSAVAPPGPIPNPVVTHGSAGEYCGGDSVGGEAAAGAPDGPDDFGRAGPGVRPAAARKHGRVSLPNHDGAGWSSGSSLGS